MTHQVALSFEDGVTRFIQVADGQTVADASYRARINIPLDCRDGACGTCKALCESGEYEHGTYIDDALSESEAAEGYCLPCQMTPKSDLVLQIASTSAVAKTQAATYTGTIVDITRYSETTIGFAIEIPDRGKLAFLPGQYVNIHVPGTDEKRSYSFSCAPTDDRLTFLVKITPGGVMSTWLSEQAEVGDEVSFTGPNGSFFLRETSRPVLLLAGGTGLAPILAILRTARDQGVDRPIRLVYGASTDADVVELDTLRALEDELADFSWDYCVSDPGSTAANKGYVMSLIQDEHLHGGDVAVYLCGPPPMVEAVRGHFSDNGVEVTGFYYEKFALAGTPESTGKPVTDAAPAEPGVAQDGAPDAPADASTDAAAATTADTAARPQPQQRRTAPGELITAPEARGHAGEEIFPATELTPLAGGALPDDEAATARRLAGDKLFPATTTGDVIPLDAPTSDWTDGDARGLAGEEVFPAAAGLTQLVERPAGTPASDDAAATAGGYVIGEEHPDVLRSDALFEARQGLELGALELMIGRLTTTQISGYRLLAEATVPYVDGDRFVDAAAFTETNAAFHDYLFTMTGNEHLLEAYRRLGVKGHMEQSLRTATWCHPLCTQDHLDIVDAFEAGDRDRARELVIAHADRSKETTRRAMKEQEESRTPRFVSPGRFADQVVVVTGAAQGIGEAVARRIRAEGGTLVLADRADLVEDLARELGGGDAATVSAVQADLETYDGAQAVVDAALDRHGRIDVAIHNVGGAICFKPFEEFTPEQIDAEVRRSLMTTLYGCRAVLAPMIDAGGGTILNVSSIATGGIYRVPYAAAKGGVNAITRALAVEAAEHGIRVVATAPGGTEAPPRRIARGPAPEGEQEQAWFQAHIDQTLGSALLGRYGTLDEQAAAICFLASREAAYVTGTVLPVGGGDLG